MTISLKSVFGNRAAGIALAVGLSAASLPAAAQTTPGYTGQPPVGGQNITPERGPELPGILDKAKLQTLLVIGTTLARNMNAQDGALLQQTLSNLTYMSLRAQSYYPGGTPPAMLRSDRDLRDALFVGAATAEFVRTHPLYEQAKAQAARDPLIEGRNVDADIVSIAGSRQLLRQYPAPGGRP